MLRPTLAAAAALISAAAMAPSAFAAQHRVPLDATPFAIPAEDCGFPIQVDVVESKEYIVKTAEADDGTLTLRVTGKLILRFSANGTSFVRDVGGPGWATFFPDGSMLFRSQGQGTGYNSPADQDVTGLPGLFFSTGNLTGVFASDGSAESVTIRGRVEDGCALLA